MRSLKIGSKTGGTAIVKSALVLVFLLAASFADAYGYVPYGESGLRQGKARYLSNDLTRFTSVDPARESANPKNPQTWNRYSYSFNDPLNLIDPDGRAPDDVMAVRDLNDQILAGNMSVADVFATVGAIGVAVYAVAETVDAIQYGIAAAGYYGISRLFRSGQAAQQEISTVQQEAAAGQRVSTLKPGPYAGESIPARGPDRRFNSAERAAGNKIGGESGCHTCGATDPGTKSGNFVLDHQPVTKLNTTNQPQRLYPQCISCSNRQGGEASQAGRRMRLIE